MDRNIEVGDIVYIKQDWLKLNTDTDESNSQYSHRPYMVVGTVGDSGNIYVAAPFIRRFDYCLKRLNYFFRHGFGDGNGILNVIPCSVELSYGEWGNLLWTNVGIAAERAVAFPADCKYVRLGMKADEFEIRLPKDPEYDDYKFFRNRDKFYKRDFHKYVEYKFCFKSRCFAGDPPEDWVAVVRDSVQYLMDRTHRQYFLPEYGIEPGGMRTPLNMYIARSMEFLERTFVLK